MVSHANITTVEASNQHLNRLGIWLEISTWRRPIWYNKSFGSEDKFDNDSSQTIRLRQIRRPSISHTNTASSAA